MQSDGPLSHTLFRDFSCCLRKRRGGSQLLNLLMPNAQLVAGIDATKARSSPFGQFMLSEMSERDRRTVEDLNFRTGFDARYDVREMVMGSRTVDGRHETLVAAAGSFNIERIAAQAKLIGREVTEYKGLTMITHPARKGDGRAAVAFLNPATAVAGNEAAVRAAVDRGTAGEGLDPEMKRKAQEASGAYDAWMVSTAPVSSFARHMPNRTADDAMRGRALETIQETRLGVRFGEQVQIDGQAITKSEADATALADVVRFLAGMITLQRPEGSPFATLLDSLRLRTDANALNLSVSMPQAELERLIRSTRRSRAGMRAAAAGE
jgi:hypothetical protein